MSVKEKIDNPFQVLVGEQLGSVTFVQDYLQLDFDGNTLTCVLWPQVVSKYLTSSFGEEQYRNELCALIAHKVLSVVFVEEIILEILFEDESKIKLTLDPSNAREVDEIATFKDVHDNWSFF